MSKIRIIMVDDHAIMRDGIRALLNLDDNIEIVGEASEGREAIKKAIEMVPDIVIMDLSMPGMDGLEATRQITKKNPKIRVLVLTQHDNKEYVLSTIKAGAAGYVPKRALGSELISAIYAVYRGESFLYPSAASALVEDYRQKVNHDDPYNELTAREREILKLIAEGNTSREIANLLFISIRTVMGHRTKIMDKLGLHNRTELIKYAMRKGLVSLE